MLLDNLARNCLMLMLAAARNARVPAVAKPCHGLCPELGH